MQKSSNEAALYRTETSWSNRILLLATAGILFLTMYPFRVVIHPLANGASPFFLGKSAKSGVVDAVLNILLFVPFGFGLAEKLRERGKSVRFVLGAALATGMLFSYGIEFSQLYIPERDSGWEDVFTNGSGSFLGAVFFLLIGVPLVRFANSIQRAVVSWLTPARFAGAIVIYFVLWVGLSAVLQRQTLFSNWKPTGELVLGSSGPGASPRQGQIKTLQIWDRPLSDAVIAAAAMGAPDLTQSGRPILDYDSSKPLDSAWVAAKSSVDGALQTTGADSAFPLRMDAGNVIAALKRTNHFTVHVVCTGVEVPNDLWGIFLIGDGAGTLDLMVWQETGHLASWLRTPLSAGRPQLTWFIPRLFNDHGPHDVLYSYDGATLLLYVDGKRTRTEYVVGPGAVLAKFVHRLRPAELQIYSYAFYALVFALAGGLLGLFEPVGDAGLKMRMVALEVAAIFLGAVGLELILMRVAQRAVSPGNLALSVALGFAGLWWAKADGRGLSRARTS
jgi:glycopeptide antibiotics resistance protein